jgi:tRNA A-37 threonylcarbamoyl transferase component Bud32
MPRPLSRPLSNKDKPSDSFREVAIGPWRAVVAERFADPFERAAQSHGLAQREHLQTFGSPSPDSDGRGATSILELPDTATRLHIRPLLHGGVFGRLTGPRFMTLKRPLDELHTTQRLDGLGAPVPGAAFVLGRRRGWFWHAAVGSVHQDNTQDGVTYLLALPNAQSLAAAARAAGSAVRKLHDLGCRHADLHVKNLLVRESKDGCEVIIVDLDGAKISDRLPPRRRMFELARLHRSLIKRGLENGSCRRTRAAFFAGYLQGDRELRRALLTTRRFEALRTGAHALFYPRRSEPSALYPPRD